MHKQMDSLDRDLALSLIPFLASEWPILGKFVTHMLPTGYGRYVALSMAAIIQGKIGFEVI